MRHCKENKKWGIMNIGAYEYFTSLLGYVDSMKHFLDRGGSGRETGEMT